MRRFQEKSCMNIFWPHVLKRARLTLGALLCTACLGIEADAASSPAAPATPVAPVKLAMIESLSGPFGNTGEAVYRNLAWAVERINARGGVRTGKGGSRPLQLLRYDSKGQNEEALSALQAALGDGAQVILQGNSSANAMVLLDAINKHNARDALHPVLFLNYSAVDPALTNELCSFWHFRFDAHANMRMAALMDVLHDDTQLHQVYLMGQDYSFGQAVLREARRQLAARRPDVRIVGEELHPVGRIKDFLPYAQKIQHSGAQAVITGNWGNDLSLLVKAAREAGFEGKFYTFYGNALGAPAAIGEAGVGKVVAVAEWFPNGASASGEAFYRSFRQRFTAPADDYLHLRMQWMMEALAWAMDHADPDTSDDGKASILNIVSVARHLETVSMDFKGHSAHMRASDHQLQQPLMVAVMDRQGGGTVKFDVEGSGFGFRVVRTVLAPAAEQSSNCHMVRP